MLLLGVGFCMFNDWGGGGGGVHCLLWGEGSQNHILVDVLTFHLNMSNAHIHVHVCLVHRLQRTKKTLTT